MQGEGEASHFFVLRHGECEFPSRRFGKRPPRAHLPKEGNRICRRPLGIECPMGVPCRKPWAPWNSRMGREGLSSPSTTNLQGNCVAGLVFHVAVPGDAFLCTPMGLTKPCPEVSPLQLLSRPLSLTPRQRSKQMTLQNSSHCPSVVLNEGRSVRAFIGSVQSQVHRKRRTDLMLCVWHSPPTAPGTYV